MQYLIRCVDAHLCWCVVSESLQDNGTQSVFHGFQRIRDQFLGDPWTHVCNDYFEVYFNF